MRTHPILVVENDSGLRAPRRLGHSDAAPLVVVAVAVAFVLTMPPVGDLWAARARASAAAHGVGLRYWFAWFGGTVPGHYSVLAPYVSRFVDVGLLGAAATVAIMPLCLVLLRGTQHRAIAVWLAAVAASFSLWSGRVPFALGSALMLLALIAVRADRRPVALAAGAVTALVSPVSAAFLILGLTGVFVHDPSRRRVAIFAASGAGFCMVGIAIWFGLPGPEGFKPVQATLAGAAVAVMLLARPPAFVRTVLLLSLAAWPVVAFVPNGMGSNFERFTWICLPVAVAATAQARRLVALAVSGLAVICGVVGSSHDLFVASEPMSAPSYYAGLISELDATRGLSDYRLEVVPDGTHVGAYALLGHAQLARGYETQSDNAYNSVLDSRGLTAAGYKTWLDDNAVGYVAIDRTTLRSGPEDRLVRTRTPSYLHPVWSDPHWRLYAVSPSSPIVAGPARVTDADQASLTMSIPRSGTFALRVRWSRFLHVDGPAPARLAPDGRGWTIFTAPQPGRYVLRG